MPGVGSPPPPEPSPPTPAAPEPPPPPPPAALPEPWHPHHHGEGEGGHRHGEHEGVAELTSLRLLRDKGIISQAEYDSALHDLKESVGEHAPKEGTVVLGKWSTTLYGFLEADSIWDTTRSLNDLSGNAQIVRSLASGGTEAGDHARFTMGMRNSRFGFKLRAPETHGVRVSAMLETDFQGPLTIGTGTGQVSEGAFFTSPTLRVRHFNMKIETPVVDVLAGQYWQLFGWQSAYQPNTVEIQGVPGEVYGRTPQLRISKTLKAEPVTFEIAIAATRPVQRDSGFPDGQGGLRFALDSWTGVQTVGSTGTQISPLSIAATGLLRRVEVDQLAASPKFTRDLTLTAVAVDAFIPVIPGTKDNKENSFSLNGEFATGYGFADQYTGLSGGVGFPTLPAAAGVAQTYTPNIDAGIVTYDARGHVHGIQWTSYLIGAQYYLPGTDGKFWVSGNYSHMESANSHYYGTAAKLRLAEDWFDVNLFVDPVPSVRIGAEYANFNDVYVDGTHAINHRLQLSGFFIF
jgi:hypothetical protein